MFTEWAERSEAHSIEDNANSEDFIRNKNQPSVTKSAQQTLLRCMHAAPTLKTNHL